MVPVEKHRFPCGAGNGDDGGGGAGEGGGRREPWPSQEEMAPSSVVSYPYCLVAILQRLFLGTWAPYRDTYFL